MDEGRRNYETVDFDSADIKFTLAISRNQVRNNDPSKVFSLFTFNEAASTWIA